MKIVKKIAIYFVFPTILLSACSYGFFLNIGQWLTPAEVPGKADVIICLSGTNDRINKAIWFLQEGMAAKVVVTTDDAYREMLQKKVDPNKILKDDWSAQSTCEEGSLVKSILGGNIKSAMVITDPFHLYRAKWTFRHIFSHASIAFSFVFSGAPSLQGFWWSSPKSRFFVLSELPKIIYYWTWHGLLGIVPDPIWATDLERSYIAFIRKVFICKGSLSKKNGIVAQEPEFITVVG